MNTIIRSFHLLQYTSRRIGYDSLIWQTPVLGLTAQAFLFTAALSHDNTRLARLIAAVLAFIASALSIQFMSKHRHHEMIDNLLLQKLEQDNGWLPLHAKPSERAAVVGLDRNWLVERSSYSVWRYGLLAFAVGAFLLIVINCFWPDLL
jgi:disulfide bond formation protein DsbB